MRMRHDFSTTALPLLNGGYLDPEAAGKQTASWNDIIAALQALQLNCVSHEKTGGWMLVGDNIVASIWDSTSLMDAVYGVEASEKDGVRFLQENSTEISPNGGN